MGDYRQSILTGAACVALMGGLAQAQTVVPRVLDEGAPSYADQPLRPSQPASPVLRNIISQPQYDAAPVTTRPLPSETLVQPPPKITLVRTSREVKRRTGKAVVAGAVPLRARKRAAISPADSRTLLGTGTPPLRPASTPIVVARNEGPGRVLPNANPYAPGAVISPETGEVMGAGVPPLRMQPVMMSVDAARQRLDDPAFAPVGLRLGIVQAVPYADVLVGYDSNPDRRPTGAQGTMFEVFSAGIDAQSDWQRHAVSLALRGAYSDYRNDTRQNRGEFSAVLRGRVDIAQEARAELEARYILAPRIPAYGTGTIERIAMTQQSGASVALERDINRLRLTLRGTVDDYRFENTPLASGGSALDAPANYTALGLRLRAQYDLNGRILPFAEGGVEHRSRTNNLVSDIYSLRGGVAVQISSVLVGEASGGVFVWNNPGQPQLRGGLVDASLAWMPTELTTVSGRVVTTLGETGVAGATAVQQHDVALQLDHAFRRYLIGTMRLGVGFDNYLGLNRNDTRYVASVGAVYKVTRAVYLRAELRHERLKSNISGNDYTANIAMLGLRVQR